MNFDPNQFTNALPQDFIWGCATASYQVEGAAAEDGRTPSIWDTFAKTPGKTIDGSDGDVAVDQYHLYPQDAEMIKSYGCKAYRLSLSWSRILPQGKKGSPVNPLAIAHYRKLFECLLSHGIEPWVTLYHWDLPQCLDDEYEGFLNTERLVEDFVYYSKVCYENFGDLVKNWMTFNEPHTFCKLGYGYTGPHAPGRTDNREFSAVGNPSVEVWRAGHSVLIAHGKSVELFRKEFQPKFGGRISIALNSDWFEPLTQDPKDVAAASRRLDFMLGWFADPIYLTGDYPASLRAQLGDRLPTFTAEESALIKGSCDYFALNSYTSMYVKDSGLEVAPLQDIDGNNIATEFAVDGSLIGPKAEAFWLFDVPWGFGKLLHHINKRYQNPAVGKILYLIVSHY
jgi:beta-glucosidase